MLSIKNLSVSYDNKIAVDRLSVQFDGSTITGLIGPNGAGKSTLMKTCIGMISNYSGEIIFNDKSLNKNRFWIKQNAVYTAENAELLNYLTGQEFLKLIANIYELDSSNDRIEFFIKLMDLEHKKSELIENYSHGMRQKLSVAAALLPEPMYILLDESLNGLDSISLKRIFEYLTEQRDKGRIIILSSHNVDLVEDWCDHVYVINHGKIIAAFSMGEIQTFKTIKGGFLKKYIELINQT